MYMPVQMYGFASTSRSTWGEYTWKEGSHVLLSLPSPMPRLNLGFLAEKKSFQVDTTWHNARFDVPQQQQVGQYS